MNALSINIPANFIASCESTLKRYNAAKTDAERRAVLDARRCRAFGGRLALSARFLPLA